MLPFSRVDLLPAIPTTGIITSFLKDISSSFSISFVAVRPRATLSKYSKLNLVFLRDLDAFQAAPASLFRSPPQSVRPSGRVPFQVTAEISRLRDGDREKNESSISVLAKGSLLDVPSGSGERTPSHST
jgi:hypothetical protein